MENNAFDEAVTILSRRRAEKIVRRYYEVKKVIYKEF